VNVRGKVALVTGAAKRLGQVVALALAEAGADLVLHAHRSSAEELVSQVKGLGRNVVVIHADLASPHEARRIAEEALSLVGNVDVLINNAAVFYPSPISSLSSGDWRSVLHVNLTAPFVLATTLGRRMQKRGSGKIIQLGDWSGQRPAPEYLPYCVSKGGVRMLTLALAKALAPHVQVNEVVLGPILPPEHYEAQAINAIIQQTPLLRLGNSADVARAIRFFVEDGDFVTGTSYVIDGGWLIRPPSGMEISL
jgi:NAD(P)-dependent dehydrogenase (short-subunit alcohol dehydrogenase family)